MGAKRWTAGQACVGATLACRPFFLALVASLAAFLPRSISPKKSSSPPPPPSSPPPSPSPPPPSAILVYSEERGKWPVLGDNIRLSSLCVLAMVRWFTPPLVVNPASTLLQQRGLLLWLGSDAPARAPAALVTCTPPFCSRGPCCSRGLHAHLHLSAHRRRCGRRYPSQRGEQLWAASRRLILAARLGLGAARIGLGAG